MRYAIFSDVHANRQAWEAVREDIVLQGADTLVCLGDVVGYGPRPLEVLSAVRAVTSNFVLGNHDAAACGRLDPSIFNERARLVIEWTREQLDQESLNFLLQVPLQMDGQELQFVHAEMREPGEFGYVDGIGPAELNLQAMTASLGFIGHTHLPLAYAMPRRGGPVKQLPPRDFTVERGQRYIVNVGSVGEPRTTDVRASYVIYDDVARTVSFRRVAFDVEGYKADLAESGLGILPYFVQVVDAGKVAGAPQPAAAPQLALAQLPSVTEVVSGANARLVVGAPVAGAVHGRPPGSRPMVVSRPRSSAPWVIGIGALVAVLLAVIAIAVLQENPDASLSPVAGAAGGSAAKAKERPSRDQSGKTGAEGGTEDTGPIRDLKVRRYGRSFQNIAELRAAAAEEHTEEEVTDGMLNLVHAGEGSCGLVWEGYLRVPEYGLYEFTLRASSGAALVIYEEEQIVSMGSIVSGRTLLRTGHAPIRVEFFQQDGEAPPALALRWSGPGLDEPLQLVRKGASSGGGVVRRASDPSPQPGPGPPEPEPTPEPEPEPVVERQAPEKITEDLFAYWPFDRREAKTQERFVKTSSGVQEKLIMAGQAVRYLRPDADPGRQWIRPDFDPSAWAEGRNGLGYEDRPGDYKDLLHTTIETTPNMHPHSLYVRIPFEVKDPEAYKGLALTMRYDDGFVAYLNGSMVGSRNNPTPLAWNSGATKQKNDRDAIKPEPLKLSTRRLQSLVPGENILAIHALNGGGGDPNDTNTGCTSSDMLIMAELVGLRKDGHLPEELQPRKPGKHDLEIKKPMIKGKVSEGPGQFREAYAFEGGSLDIGSKNSFAIADTSYTISLWFARKPDLADGQARHLISAGGSSEQQAGWSLLISEDGSGLAFRLSDGHRRSDLPAKKEGLGDGKWHHAAVTIDRENSQVHLFIDGELAAEPMNIEWLAQTVGSSSGLCIGRNSDAGEHHLGKIDDVALWRRALLPEEVQKLFGAGTSAGDLFATEGG